MNTAQIRKSFLDFFAERGHEVVPSSALVPESDPTLLFTNAGMVQFKDTFLGLETRDYTKAVSSQICVRAGGKHNDLENVGYTARHHTFFEMLGNFSFGDYFKQQAISYAWEFLTSILKLDPERLWVSVYKEDDESAKIWQEEIGIPAAKISRCGSTDNFWSMGDTGPCGPCSEIFYDHGDKYQGGPPGSKDQDGDRFVEIWNLVFMQYNRDSDGELSNLPTPAVDTGMGLERIAAVIQGVHSNYDIDIFHNIIKGTAKLLECQRLQNKSLRVIADHLRSSAFLVADGVYPSNDGRGYVLRRIMRRAIRHGRKLGTNEVFFHKLVELLVNQMGDAYPLLVTKQAEIQRVFLQEEQQFSKTIEQGIKYLDEVIDNVEGGVIPGEKAFKLYDTYGFPLDLTQDIAREKGLSVYLPGFDKSMEKQRDKARSASNFKAVTRQIDTNHQSEFCGYAQNTSNAKVLEIFQGNKPISTLKPGSEAALVLDVTPFYAEAGGQVADTGIIAVSDAKFVVSDTQQHHDAFLHYGKLQTGTIKVNDNVNAVIDEQRRHKIRLNHTATHLLHAALKKVLGDNVQQKGSVVDSNRLRFDFSYSNPVAAEDLQAIENLVNQQILANEEIITQVMPRKSAMKLKATALFMDKYQSEVRVLTIGKDEFSIELCGGTHAKRTGDLGLFKIISETGVAAGIRRVEAVTAMAALEVVNNYQQVINKISLMLKTDIDNLEAKITEHQQTRKDLEKNIDNLNQQLAKLQLSKLISKAKQIKGVNVLSAKLSNVNVKHMRDMVDGYKQKLGTAVVALGLEANGKANIVVGVTNDCVDNLSAVDLVNTIAVHINGKGGGRKDYAQAGGTNPEHLDKALEQVYDLVADNL